MRPEESGRQVACTRDIDSSKMIKTRGSNIAVQSNTITSVARNNVPSMERVCSAMAKWPERRKPRYANERDQKVDIRILLHHVGASASVSNCLQDLIR